MTAGAVVPAYFHPGAEPEEWDHVLAVGAAWACVVVNVADGPGARASAPYLELAGRLARAGVRAAGYVDVDYGARPEEKVRRDVLTWRDEYGVAAVFLDRFPARRVGRVARTVDWLREAAAPLVVANPGVHPATPGDLRGVDVCVTFEGTWRAYRRLVPPVWAASCEPGSLVHLVHAAPAAVARRLGETGGPGGAPCYATDRAGANPWRAVFRGGSGATAHRAVGARPGGIEQRGADGASTPSVGRRSAVG